MAAATPNQTPVPTNTQNEERDAHAASNVSRLDPSLIHQVTQLQKENQGLYQERRDLETKLKEEQKEKEDLKASLLKMQEERASGNRKEMEEFRENFMREWMVFLNPKMNSLCVG
jgi:predicted RNase H-like nuclease (RuvC/YqgF family)